MGQARDIAVIAGDLHEQVLSACLAVPVIEAGTAAQRRQAADRAIACLTETRAQALAMMRAIKAGTGRP